MQTASFVRRLTTGLTNVTKIVMLKFGLKFQFEPEPDRTDCKALVQVQVRKIAVFELNLWLGVPKAKLNFSECV